ncbi:MAG: Na(+)-translocating NADH-quinone reductase subunit A [Muribaculaceae bacterium]|nr:Na(+)-translocating NADH-quinone reductase subunit A [Muribaculaceae bacterium]
MANIITIKKGLDIPLKGKIKGNVIVNDATTLFAISPEDFPGYTWKAAVKAGDSVKCGTPLLYAKECESLKLTSPVSGTVEEIHRGERRKIEYVSVRKEGSNTQIEIDKNASVLDKIMQSGLFAMMRQRPFDIVPSHDIKPRDIFVTAFDSAPLAGELISAENAKYLESGLKALASLTSGKVYLGVKAGSGISSDIAIVTEFAGPHPAGNVGTQIAAIKPVNKGETVWTLNAATACRIGELVTEGIIDYTCNVALTGPSVKEPHVVKTVIGAKLSTLLNGQLSTDEGKVRVISGNVLTGEKVSEKEGYLHYPYTQITAIPEGDHADEFMGWASLNPKKFSVSHAFPAFLRGLKKPFDFDARIKGGHRAMIMSGEYDKVFPMDIYPEYLIKSILAKNIERMEERGIYEVAPEDFALPEFVDTSKLELQKIVREGLDYLRKELN